MKEYTFQPYPGVEKIPPVRSDKPAIVDDKDGLLRVIFAPDETTGNPRSDLLLETRIDNPMLQEYIRNHFQRPIDVSPGVDDADLALTMDKDPFESVSEYAERLRDIVNNR